MATKAERIKSLELAIEEQRRDYDVVKHLYSRAQTKIISFLTAGFVLLGFLYSNVSSNTSLSAKLFIPKEPYGVIIYFISLAAYLSSLMMLLLALKPRSWSTAFDDEQEDIIMQQGYEEYLIYMKKRYLRCSRINTKSYNAKSGLLDMSLLPMLVGGIMLLILKTFGG
ncbi:MAG TPA: hypothetical protein VGF75_00145 [Candidatus Saccharimonadales bacterium]|jgi:hypothetical protein